MMAQQLRSVLCQKIPDIKIYIKGGDAHDEVIPVGRVVPGAEMQVVCITVGVPGKTLEL